MPAQKRRARTRLDTVQHAELRQWLVTNSEPSRRALAERLGVGHSWLNRYIAEGLGGQTADRVYREWVRGRAC
jgi:hypothetical protein